MFEDYDPEVLKLIEALQNKIRARADAVGRNVVRVSVVATDDGFGSLDFDEFGEWSTRSGEEHNALGYLNFEPLLEQVAISALLDEAEIDTDYDIVEVLVEYQQMRLRYIQNRRVELIALLKQGLEKALADF